MKSTVPLALSAILLAAMSSFYAQEPSELETAKQEYEEAAPHGEDAARARYVNKLSHILSRLFAEHAATNRYDNPQLWDSILGELNQHPVPTNSDPEALAKLIVGKWESPRRIYEYRKDGTLWVWNGDEDPVPRGTWHIDGNQLQFSEYDDGTLLVLDGSFLIYTDGETSFFHARVSRDDKPAEQPASAD